MYSNGRDDLICSHGNYSTMCSHERDGDGVNKGMLCDVLTREGYVMC